MMKLALAKLWSQAPSSSASAWGLPQVSCCTEGLQTLKNQLLSRVPPLLEEMTCLQATRGQTYLLIYEMLYHGIREKKFKQSDSARQLKKPTHCK